MNALWSFWESQPAALVTIALFIFAIGVTRAGSRFLARWLGLTQRNASRISALLMVGVWLVIYIFVTFLRAGA